MSQMNWRLCGTGFLTSQSWSERAHLTAAAARLRLPLEPYFIGSKLWDRCPLKMGSVCPLPMVRLIPEAVTLDANGGQRYCHG